MRVKVTETILDILQGGAEATIDLFDIMTRTYLDSYKEARKRMMGYSPGFHFEKRWADEYKRKMSFYSTLSRLKKDGLVSKTKNESGTFWKITAKGKTRQKKEKGRIMWTSKVRKSSVVTIVSYDIPETLRGNRIWLLGTLKLLGLALVHKSVFAGAVQLPKEFLSELGRRDILDYIHIFEVTKRGTLKEVS